MKNEQSEQRHVDIGESYGACTKSWCVVCTHQQGPNNTLSLNVLYTGKYNSAWYCHMPFQLLCNIIYIYIYIHIHTNICIYCMYIYIYILS